jgi:hypothetical protein
MGFQLDSKPTKVRDVIIFLIAMIGMAYLFRDQLAFFITDGGSLLQHDSEYDYYLIATDKVHPLAAAIQQQCNKHQSCPQFPAGWNKNPNVNESFRGAVRYQPATPVTTNAGETIIQSFRITYDYMQGWRLIVSGGVNTQLSTERIKLEAD